MPYVEILHGTLPHIIMKKLATKTRKRKLVACDYIKYTEYKPGILFKCYNMSRASRINDDTLTTPAAPRINVR